MKNLNTVGLSDFHRAFEDYNRADNFSYEALDALYKWLKEFADDTYKLDVIAICCAFSEYADLDDVKENYPSLELETIDDLRKHTSVIEFDGGFIILNF